MPTQPIKAVSAPSFRAATARFAGAPPGIAAKIVLPFASVHVCVMSIRISPMVVILIFMLFLFSSTVGSPVLFSIPYFGNDCKEKSQSAGLFGLPAVRTVHDTNYSFDKDI